MASSGGAVLISMGLSVRSATNMLLVLDSCCSRELCDRGFELDELVRNEPEFVRDDSFRMPAVIDDAVSCEMLDCFRLSTFL